MIKNDSALFYTCSLIEYIGRDRKLERADVVNYLGKEIIDRIYRYSDVLHCEPIESVAYRYIEKMNIPSGDYERIFTELKIPFVKGRVWTTDCMIRETVNLVNMRKSEGCIAVEMEVAGVQAVCDFYGFELYDFLVPGDVLAENDYQLEGLSDANHNIDKFQISLQIAERI